MWTTVWPGKEPWGAGPDLYRTLDDWNSAYIKPVGERNQATFNSRWSSPEMDAIIKELRETDPFDTEKVVEMGIRGLQEAVRNMPGIPTYGYIGFVGWDEHYWTNWPGSENAYNQALYPLAQLQIYDPIPETNRELGFSLVLQSSWAGVPPAQDSWHLSENSQARPRPPRRESRFFGWAVLFNQ